MKHEWFEPDARQSPSRRRWETSRRGPCRTTWSPTWTAWLVRLADAGWALDTELIVIPGDADYAPGVSRLLHQAERVIEVELLTSGLLAVHLDAERLTPEDEDPPWAPGTYDLETEALMSFYETLGLLPDRDCWASNFCRDPVRTER